MASLQEALASTVNSVKSDANKYGALISSGASFAGVDQGIDFTGGPASVYALGSGTVERVASRGSGWPGQGALLTYRINDGPLAGKHVYVAEDFTPDPRLKVGSPVQKGQPLGYATGSGLAPGIEVGWADPSGRAFGTPTEGPTSYGYDFQKTVQALNPNGGGGGFFGGVVGVAKDVGKAATIPVGAPFGMPSGSLNDAARHVPGVAQTEDTISSVGDAIKFVTSWRFAEIVAGFLLLIVGLLLLGRQFGLNPPVPSPFGSAASSAADTAGPISSQPRRTQGAAGFTLAADRKPARGQAGSSQLAAGDELPF